MAVVVLPTPPFWFAIAITFAICFFYFLLSHRGIHSTPKYHASIAIKLQFYFIILLTNVKGEIFAKNPTFVAEKIEGNRTKIRRQLF
jgi:hypothetical protein